MLKMPNTETAAADLSLETGAPNETIITSAPALGLSLASGGHSAPPCPREQLVRLLSDAQAELDRLQSITLRAGYKIAFRHPSGIIIDYADASESGASKPQARGGLAPSVLRRVRQYIEANLESRIELADLAAIANLSRCHFACAFKQSLGSTPHRYVMSRRLERAAQLLGESDLPIVEIGLATGFADQSHFSRCFRAFFGLSPLAFRRAQR